MRDNTVSRGESLGLTLLLILFIGLKLTGYIDWSWWWVLSPIWVPLVLFVVVFSAVVFVAAIRGR